MKVTLTRTEKVAMLMNEEGFAPAVVKETTGVGMSRIDKISSRQRREINRGLVTNMLLEAFEYGDTSNEMINAAKELGKLHGLYEAEKTITISGTFEEAQRQITNMSNEELQRLLIDVEDIEGEFIANDE
jgi:hypothetical protein